MKIIILAGGSGTRLWPLSRNRYPKQFIKLQDQGTSLFQETFMRSMMLADQEDIYVVTHQSYQFFVTAAVEELGYVFPQDHILVEPEAKNTLPAIYAGVHEILKSGNDTVVVFPSDHVIAKADKFAKIIRESVGLTQDSIITFGIQPDLPHTGYGYIAPGEIKLNGYRVNAFKEKPELDLAVSYVEQGYYWNAGIFMFDAVLFRSEVERYAPEIVSAFESSVDLFEAFGKIETKISIDYGIMEKSDCVAVVPAEVGWNDLGSFDAFYDVMDKDQNDNIVHSDNIVIGSKNNLIVSEEGKLVSAVGVDDLIVVDNRDALLICKRDQSQLVKELVSTLKARGDSRIERHVQDYRAWGKSKVLEEEDGLFKINRVTISPGKGISYQMHQLRSEHWVIVKGRAKITIDDLEREISAGESTFIQPGQKHRIENIGDDALEMIEVQMGHVKEADIIRFDSLD